MYQINSLNRPTLITPDEVLFHSASSQDMDARTLLSNIIIAEDRFIAPALGNAFYKELISQKNRKVTAGNQAYILGLINETRLPDDQLSAGKIPVGTVINALEFISNVAYRELWEMYLNKICAECVDYVSIVPSWLKSTAAGQMLNNPKSVTGNEGSASGDRGDVKFKMQVYMQDRIDPLLERLKLYIFENKGDFPTYPFPAEHGCNNHKEPDGISLYRKTDWIFGVYDHDEPVQTVSLKTSVLTLSNPGQHYLSQLPVLLTITSTSPEHVQLYSADTSVAEVYTQAGNWYIRMKTTGTTTIYASQAAGSGYAAAEATGTITIIPDNTNAFNYTL